MTRVLLVNHPEGDFLETLVFTGLVQLLGEDNVVDYPPKLSYRGKMHEYPSPYSSVVGPSGGIMPWERRALVGTDVVGTTGPFSWMHLAVTSREWSKDEVISGMRGFDFILFPPRTYAEAALSDLVSAVGLEKLPPRVLLDGEDYSPLRSDLVERFRVSLYLKRELLPGQGCGCRLEPFSLASPVSELVAAPASGKDVDVLFQGGGTWAGRQDACDALRQEFGERFVGGVSAHVGHQQYMETFARARVAISVRGFGFDSLKVWEIPSCEGTMLVADKLPILRSFPLVDQEHCCYFNDTGHLLDVVRHALADEERRARIARQGNAWVMAHHTPRARAVQLLEIAKSL